VNLLLKEMHTIVDRCWKLPKYSAWCPEHRPLSQGIQRGSTLRKSPADLAGDLRHHGNIPNKDATTTPE
jgi:hypothetical protein